MSRIDSNPFAGKTTLSLDQQMQKMSDFEKIKGMRNQQPIQNKTNLDQADFLKLLSAQMSNQNPLEPQDSKEFIAQMANFSMNDGIQNLQKAFTEFSSSMHSNQALQATTLVGRTVEVPGNIGRVSATQAMKGFVEVPSDATSVNISFYNPKGELVHTMKVEGRDSVPFSWDGKNAKGEQVSDGLYQFHAEATINGKPVELPTSVYSNVESVNLDQRYGITLNVADVGTLTMSDVRSIG